MKKRLLLFVIAALPMLVHAEYMQSVFPDTWNEVFFSSPTGAGDELPPYPIYCTFYLSGDTAISDTTYKRLYIDGHYPGQKGTFSHSYVANIRISSDGQQIYIQTNGEEYLLFDFSVNVGDTCRAYFGIDAILASQRFTDKKVVKDLIVLSKGDYNGYPSIVLKKLNAPDNLSNRTTWIEGVGSTIGLSSFPPDVAGVTTPVLLCAYSDGQQLYMAPDESISAWGYKNACPEVELIPDDISNTATKFSEFSPCYTILGTLAGEDYHGIVIQNGKIFIKR